MSLCTEQESRLASSPTPKSSWSGWASDEITTVSLDCCLLCGGRANRPYASGYDYELSTCRNLWKFEQCCDCGHVQLNPRPSEAALSVIYPPTYYSYDMASKISSWILKAKKVLDDFRLQSITDALGKLPHSYLDIGCGDGKYLDRMRSKGVQASNLIGIELSSVAVAQAQTKGYRVFNKMMEQCDEIEQGSVDLITLFHVIEHVSDPLKCAQRISAWLSPGGVLAIETPNRNSVDAKWFQRSYWGGYHFPRHWHLFEDHQLVDMLKRCGLEVVGTKYVSGHSFWLYSLHHLIAYNERWPMPKVAKIFDPLRSKIFLAIVTGFDYARAILGFKTSSVLVIARKP